MMRRLISMLAAGVLAAGTLFTTAGAASADAAAVHHRADCTLFGFSRHLNVQVGNTYFLGTPVRTFSGAVVRLKPNANSTTNWTFCFVSGSGNEFVLFNQGLALTSREGTGGLVTVTTAPGGTGGIGFASQRWHVTSVMAGTLRFQNEKTSLWLRIRNSGPFFGQTVTTGATPRDWIDTF
jgi:hypothetical protein